GWNDPVAVDALKSREVQPIDLDGQLLALIYNDGVFSALAGRCVHAGGPLGEGRLKGDYLVCPWHGWHFPCRTGEGRPGYGVAVPRYERKVEEGRLWVRTTPSTAAMRKPADTAHPLTRPIERTPGPPRVVGISTTALNRNQPRYSTSED